MKQGRFITHPDLSGKKYDHPWKNKKFNSYERVFEPGEGILNVKCEFTPDPSKKLESATVRATALGIFDMFVNGMRVVNFDGDTAYADELKPGWTDYRFRVFEFEYDITALCVSGGRTGSSRKNIFTAEVSPGWWTGRISFGFYGSLAPAFCGEIELRYRDGSAEILASGEDWDASICGPVMRADIWDGEYYDATVPEPSVVPEAHEWKKAVAFSGFGGRIEPVAGPRIRSCGRMMLDPVSAVIHSGKTGNGTEFGKINILSKKTGDGCETAKLKPGEAMIVDFGQNMVGRPMLFLNAPRGTRVEVFFAEMLNDSGDPGRGNDGPEGSLYIKNYRSATARLVYIASGTDEVEFYYPTHTFFGFRYIEIRADADLSVINVRGDVIRSDCPEGGDFECDVPEVNRLFSNIVWGMRGNYLSVPTDCPQRDERLGWTGDTQIFCGAASYIADIRGFMDKWLTDAAYSQEGFGGAYADVIPRVFTSEGGNAAWGDAPLVVTDRLYMMYGDKEAVRKNYAPMEAYMDYLSRFGLEGPNTAYGDWLNYDVTDKRYIAVCYYAHDAELMAKFSHILGLRDREEHYMELREKIVGHYRDTYIKDGKLTVGTQTGYLLALAFNLVQPELRESFIAALKEKIVSNGYTLSTGFVGTGILNQTLSKVGLDGLAYSLLMQDRDPSWLYSVKQGATTVWERWNSYTKERGFGDVGMNSFNHYAYGAVAEWLFAGVCGIRPDPMDPGFRSFILKPTPDFRTAGEMPEGGRRMRIAKASYTPPCAGGEKIESGWEIYGGKTVYTFRIPEGLSAKVSLVPGDGAMKVNGLDVTPEELGASNVWGRTEFRLGSGRYRIEIQNPNKI